MSDEQERHEERRSLDAVSSSTMDVFRTHSPLKLDKEQDRTRFESFSKKICLQVKNLILASSK